MATSVGVSPIPGLATVATRSSSLLLLENPSVGRNNRRENRAVATAGRHPDNTYSASTSSNLPGGLDSVNPLLSLSLSLSLTDTGLEDGVVGIHLLSSILQKNQSSSA